MEGYRQYAPRRGNLFRWTGWGKWSRRRRGHLRDDAAQPSLPPHRLKVAVLQPQIAPNTGNIARLCVATGSELHLVRPMGFVLSDRELKRSAMDYWPRLKLTVHDDDAAFFRSVEASGNPAWLFSSKAARSFWHAEYRDGD